LNQFSVAKPVLGHQAINCRHSGTREITSTSLKAQVLRAITGEQGVYKHSTLDT
jgi:hypothetical protein